MTDPTIDPNLLHGKDLAENEAKALKATVHQLLAESTPIEVLNWLLDTLKGDPLGSYPIDGANGKLPRQTAMTFINGLQTVNAQTILDTVRALAQIRSGFVWNTFFMQMLATAAPDYLTDQELGYLLNELYGYWFENAIANIPAEYKIGMVDSVLDFVQANSGRIDRGLILTVLSNLSGDVERLPKVKAAAEEKISNIQTTIITQ